VEASGKFVMAMETSFVSLVPASQSDLTTGAILTPALRGGRALSVHGSIAATKDSSVKNSSNASLLMAGLLTGGVIGMSSRRRASGRRNVQSLMTKRAEGEGEYLRARDRIDGHGWMKQDQSFDPQDKSAYGSVVQFDVKKRPMGVTRFTHGADGKGAMVAEMHEKSRYPGDPRGQVHVGGVKPGFLLKSIGGQDVTSWDFVDIMDLLNDVEPDYNVTQAAKEAWAARTTNHQPTELPVTLEYVEFTIKEEDSAPAPKIEGKWYPRSSGYSDADLEAELARAKKEFPVPADYAGVVYDGPSSVTEEWIKSLITQQKEGVLLPKSMAYELVIDVIKLQQKEKTMGKITVPPGECITVIGDTHGQYFDVMTLLELNGLPSPKNPYIFNGDFVDRGSWSMENILLLYAFKAKDPDFVHFNRGNHELIEANLIYGFCGECTKKYDAELFDLFSESFRLLSLCHLVNDECFVVHAGLPGPTPRLWLPGQSHDPEDAIPVNESTITLDQIAKIDRYTELQDSSYKNCVGETPEEYEKNVDKDTAAMIDFLWADPRGGAGYGPSYRKSRGIFMFGPDVTDKFCKDNNLKMVIRSHEVKDKGWKQDHPQLWTVFSAPDYMDTGGNQGGFLKITNVDGELKVNPSSFPKTEHPPLPPMIWQEYMMLANPHLTKKMKKKTGLKYDKDGNVIAEIAVEQGDDDFVQQGMADEWVVDEDAVDGEDMTQEQIDAAFAEIVAKA